MNKTKRGKDLCTSLKSFLYFYFNRNKNEELTVSAKFLGKEQATLLFTHVAHIFRLLSEASVDCLAFSRLSLFIIERGQTYFNLSYLAHAH
jgi:hypothetical protein